MTAVPTRAERLLVDTNLLVLFAVGTVNRNRIASFKRTSKYTTQDFDLLLRVLGQWKSLCSVAHVLSEVSNLTDLTGAERPIARTALKQTISILSEMTLSSVRASEDPLYAALGLVDASIAAVAREHRCSVLTDDLDLFLRLQRDKVEVLNFTYLRAQALGIE